MAWGPSRFVIELWLHLLAFWITLFGPGWAYFWARAAAWWGWLLLRRLRQVTLRNVDLCFPEKPQAERTQISRASFRHFCYVFVDYLLAPRYITQQRWQKYYDKASPDGHPYLLWSFEEKPAFNLSAHYGNWEIGSWTVGRHGRSPLLVIAKAVHPPLLNRWIVRAREAMGNEVIENKGGARAWMRAIKEKRRLAVLIDQNGGDFAPVETFFGIPCTWQSDFTRVCLRGGGRVAHSIARRLGEKFQFEFLEPELLHYPPETEPMQIMRNYRDYLQRVIRDDPGQYFWMHRRFKARKPGWPDAYADLGKRWGQAERDALIAGRK